MRRFRVITTAIAVVVSGAFISRIGPTLAVEVAGLYTAETIVTGKREAERRQGFRTGLEEILIKLSGDAGLAGSEKIRPLIDRADRFVEAYEYEDRLKGIPIQDEQGTRDRSYYLRITFDRVALDRAMRDQGIPRWTSDRAKLAVWLGIEDGQRAYVLGTASEFGYGQREALKSISRRRGVPIALPVMDAQDRARLAHGDIAAGDLERLRAASGRYGADGVLFGTLVFDGLAYWTMDWSLDWRGTVHRWQIDGVTFDVALRAAIEAAAKILSERE